MGIFGSKLLRARDNESGFRVKISVSEMCSCVQFASLDQKLESFVFPTSFQIKNDEIFINRISKEAIRLPYGNLSFQADSCISVIGDLFDSSDLLRHTYKLSSTHLTSIVFPRSLEIIGVSCFSNLEELKYISFAPGSRLKKISRSAFELTSIDNIIFPSSLEEIDDFAFFFVSSLNSVVFEDDSRLKRVGKRAFLCCNEMENFSFPKNIEIIDDEAFRLDNYVKLDGIFRNLVKIGRHASTYWNTSNFRVINKDVQLDFNIFEFIEIVEHDSSLKENEIVINGRKKTITIGNCENFVVHMNDLYSAKQPMVISFSRKGRRIFIRKGTEKISRFACQNHPFIKSIVFPASVNRIGCGAFCNCRHLRSVVFAKDSKLKIIDKFSFRFCEDLSYIKFPAQLKKIGKFAFASTGLRSIKFPPNSELREICSAAFVSCSLESIEFPDSLKEIRIEAFRDNSSLTSIKFSTNSTIRDISSLSFYNCPSIQTVIFPQNKLMVFKNAELIRK